MIQKGLLTEKEREELRQQRIKEQKEWFIEYFNRPEKFESRHDIVDIPVFPHDFMDEVIIPGLIRRGAIPKDQLEVGKEYYGSCRNSGVAKWNGKEFEYDRYKWGFTYKDTIRHFQDYDDTDFFIPIKLKED